MAASVAEMPPACSLAFACVPSKPRCILLRLPMDDVQPIEDSTRLWGKALSDHDCLKQFGPQAPCPAPPASGPYGSRPRL